MTMFFARNGILTNPGGGGGGAAAPSPPPPTSYAYDLYKQFY